MGPFFRFYDPVPLLDDQQLVRRKARELLTITISPPNLQVNCLRQAQPEMQSTVVDRVETRLRCNCLYL